MILRKTEYQPHFKLEQVQVSVNHDIDEQIIVPRFADHGKVRHTCAIDYMEHKTIFRVLSTGTWPNTNPKYATIIKNLNDPHLRHILVV